MPSKSKRIYLRGLPKDIGEDAMIKYLSSYGKIVEVKLVHDYGFVQFDSEKDAQDVVDTFRRQPFLGRSVIVEFARPLRKRILSRGSSNTEGSVPSVLSRPAPENVQCRYPVIITNIPREVRWQELKDFGRLSGGLVAYCDLDKNKRGQGFIEYFSREDAERAIRTLDGRYLGSKIVRVSDREFPPMRGRIRARSRSPSYSRYPIHSPPSIGVRRSPTFHYPSYPNRYVSPPPPEYSHAPTPYYHPQRSPPRYRARSRSPIRRDPTPPVSEPHVHQPMPYAYHVDPYSDTPYEYTAESSANSIYKYDYDYSDHFAPRYHDYDLGTERTQEPYHQNLTFSAQAYR